MSGAQLHLMLIHFPIAGTFLTIPLLLAAWSSENESWRRMGLSLAVITGLFAFGAFFTGEGAEHVVKQMSDISIDLIHEHEEAADYAIWLLGLNTLLAGYGLSRNFKRRPVPVWCFRAVFVLTILSAAAMTRVSWLGGHIHHPETRSGFAAPAETGGKP